MEKTFIEQMEEKDLRLICLNNGVYSFYTNELLSHNPNFYFFAKVETNYIKGVDCPIFKKFIKRSFGEENIPIIQEMFGATLLRTNQWRKSYILESENEIGKTVLVNTLYSMLGDKNVSNVSIKDICDKKNSPGELFIKMANICENLPPKKINNTEVFRNVTGDGYITGKQKLGKKISFTNYATLIFTCNKIPECYNDNNTYYNRFVIINSKQKLSEEEIDRNLFNKLETELSGILNFAIEGAQKLLKDVPLPTIKTPNTLIIIE